MAERWQLGVAVPVADPHFNFFDRIVKLATDYTGGTTMVVDTNVAAVPYVLSGGNRIIAGPSSNSSWKGAIEGIDVSSVSTVTITLSGTGLAASFKEGDPVIIRTGSRSWNLQDTGTHSDRRYSIVDGQNPVTAFPYAQRIQGNDPAGVWGPYHYFINQLLQINSGDPQCPKYRLSFLYKNTGDFTYQVWPCDAQGVRISGAGEDGTIITNQASWTLETMTFNKTQQEFNRFEIVFFLTGDAEPHDLIIDHVIVEHAWETSGEASGFLELTTLADANTIQFANRLGGLKHDLASGGHRRTYRGTRIDKFQCSGRFTHLSGITYRDLAILQSWQQRNRQIVLRPSLDYLPSMAVGYMQVADGALRMWDYTLPSCSFEFIEA